MRGCFDVFAALPKFAVTILFKRRQDLNMIGASDKQLLCRMGKYTQGYLAELPTFDAFNEAEGLHFALSRNLENALVRCIILFPGTQHERSNLFENTCIE